MPNAIAALLSMRTIISYLYRLWVLSVGYEYGAAACLFLMAVAPLLGQNAGLSGLIADPSCKIYGAQATGCSPITTALKNGQDTHRPVRPPNTMLLKWDAGTSLGILINSSSDKGASTNSTSAPASLYSAARSNAPAR